MFVLYMLIGVILPVSKVHADSYSHADDGMIMFHGPKNAHNLLVTELNWGDDSEPGKIVAEADILPIKNPSDSWTPSLRFYWSESKWVSIGISTDGKFLTYNAGRFGNAPLGKWYTVRMVLENGKVEMWGGEKGTELNLLTTFNAPVSEAPSHLIIGKGFGNGTPTYPNPFTANDASPLGEQGLIYMDNVRLWADDQLIIEDDFGQGVDLSRWTIYMSDKIQPAALIEVYYDAEGEITDISDEVIFVNRKFIVPESVAEFTFKDGNKYMKVVFNSDEWVIKEVKQDEPDDCSHVDDGLVMFLGPENAHNLLVTELNWGNNSEPGKIVAEADILPITNPGASWTPSLKLYWSESKWVSIGIDSYKKQFIIYGASGRFGNTPLGKWYTVRMVLENGKLEMWGGEKGTELGLLTTLNAPSSEPPSHLIIGKGFGNGTPTYPNPFTANDVSPLGEQGLTYMDNVSLWADEQLIIEDDFEQGVDLSRWTIYMSDKIQPVLLVKVHYNAEGEVTDISDEVIFVNGKFIVPEGISEFAFRDGDKYMKAVLANDEWTISEAEKIEHIYVSPEGNDDNLGTIDQPFATINKAAKAATPGTTVHVLPGIYTEPIIINKSGTADARVRFVSEERWGAKINVARQGDKATAMLFYGDYIDIEGFEITGDCLYGINGDGFNVRIIGNHIYDLAPKEDRLGGAAIVAHDSVEVIGNLVHNIGPEGEESNLIHGIYTVGTGVKILNNITYSNAGWGIHAWHKATNTIISNNLIFGNRKGGVEIGSSDSTIIADNFVVTNNIIIYNNNDGVIELGKTGPNNKYENNVVYGNVGKAFRLHDGKIDHNTLILDPQLVDFKSDGSGDYHLTAISPCIGNGTKFGAPSIDYDGNERLADKAIDIGPFQFTGQLPIRVKVPYEAEGDITESSNGVFFADGNFMVPENVTEFTFKDGYRVMSAELSNGEWVFEEAERLLHIYVSPQGNDDNPGTKEYPFATINKAATAATPGATVHVLPGIYTDPIKINKGGTEEAWIRLVSEEKWGAKINVVSRGSLPLTVEEGYVEIEGFEITGNDVLYGINVRESNVRIISNHIYGIAPNGGPWGSAIVTYDSEAYKIHSVDIIGNLIHDIGPKDGSGGNIHGIYIAGNNMKVINNISHSNSGFGIHTWNAARNCTISNNLVFKNGTGGIKVGAGETPVGIIADNFIVTNNIVIHNGNVGIIEAGATGPNNKYENNLVYENTGNAFELQDGKADINTLTVDPKFVDFKADGSGDYHLIESSPCIATGTKLGAPSVDFDGNARPSDKAVDIGPYQFTSEKPGEPDLEEPTDPKDPEEPYEPEEPQGPTVPNEPAEPAKPSEETTPDDVEEPQESGEENEIIVQVKNIINEIKEGNTASVIDISLTDLAEDIYRKIINANNLVSLIDEPQIAIELSKSLIDNSGILLMKLAVSNNYEAHDSISKELSKLVETVISIAGTLRVDFQAVEGRAEGEIILGEVEDGKLVDEYTEKKLDLIVATAKQLKESLEKAGVEAEIKPMLYLNAVNGADNTASAELKIPANLIIAANEKGVAGVVVTTDVAEFTVPSDAIELKKDSVIVLNSEKIDNEALSGEVKKSVGDAPIYDLSFTVDNERVAKFNKLIKVSIPYTLKDSEDAEKVTVFYINEKGELENIIGVYNNDTKRVYFETEHFSMYTVKVDNVRFNDVASTFWAANYIEVMASKGVIMGIGGNFFAPDRNVTRAEFVAMVVREFKLFDSKAVNNFNDVNEKDWFYPEVTVAANLGIIQGRPGGIFAPNDKITREEMAKILSNVLTGIMGKKMPANKTAYIDVFKDKEIIADYAKDAVAMGSRYKFFTGRPDGTFAPKDNANRAEASKLIYMLFYIK